MLEVGRAGSAGTEKGVVPVLREDVVVATLRAAKWKATATAMVDGRTWTYGRQVAESGTTGRWAWRPTLTAEDSLPPAHQVFRLWLEMVLRRRAAAPAGAATAAGGAAAAGAAG